MYSTHGLMTVSDLAEYRLSYDLDAWKDEEDPNCPGHFVRGERFNEVSRIERCTYWDNCPEV